MICSLRPGAGLLASGFVLPAMVVTTGRPERLLQTG
jgi:hypothetical protein